MKLILQVILLLWYQQSIGQILRPHSISVSFLGETVTHPGLKAGIHYQLGAWNKTNKKNNELFKEIGLSPQIGLFHHADYQTNFITTAEIYYSRKKSNGYFKSIGFGSGYMRSLIPNVYEQQLDGDYEKINAGKNYFINNVFITFGRDLSIKKNIPLDIFTKIQLLHATPNTPKGLTYFILELGMNYQIRTNHTAEPS